MDEDKWLGDAVQADLRLRQEALESTRGVQRAGSNHKCARSNNVQKPQQKPSQATRPGDRQYGAEQDNRVGPQRAQSYPQRDGRGHRLLWRRLNLQVLDCHVVLLDADSNGLIQRSQSR